ncbi:VCBS repeat-containing protein [Tellurirhabdus rosea]|uniref:VCBS repeat-containing protein n=1 Tax=Tellurirhabdus rosea TaxID=2674997 RepID=UPI0022528FDB|nr:VCBS repeat-containing protein [Tellurirhabdus rosea]
MKYLLPILLFPLLLACKTEDEKLFADLPASETGLDFVNRSLDKPNFNIFNYRNFYNGGGVAIGDVNNDGLPDVFLTSNFEENKLYLNRTDGPGQALKFEDVTKAAGIVGKKFWSTGVTFADVNGDGWLDIYVCNSGSRDARGNQLFINQGFKNGIPQFAEKAQEYGLADGGFSTHAAFFDYDRDGDLDMYLLNNSFTPMDRLQFANIRDTRDKLGGDKLFRNRMVERRKAGKGGEEEGASGPASPSSPSSPSSPYSPLFEDVSAEAGIYGSLIGFGLGITIGDVNNDNWPDIYISNDFYERDFLYINQKNGTFKESVKEYMNHISLASMGADIADLNNDGNLDIFVTDMMPEDDYRLKTTTSFDSYEIDQLRLQRDFYHQDSRNMLHLNNGPGPDGQGTFSEVGRMAGTHATDWSWGALLFDMDMDGKKDIFVANGILKDLTDQDFVSFLGDNPDIQLMIEGIKKFDYKEYVDKMGTSPLANYAFKGSGDGLHFTNQAAEWGLGTPGFSSGAAYGDLDNDGDLDLVVNNNNAAASIYQNQSVEKNKANFLRVKLAGTPMNRSGIGAKVYVHQKGETQYLQQMPNRGFQSSVDLTMVFGLGTHPAIDSLTVIWPGVGGGPDKKQVLRQPKANTTLTLDVRNAAQPVTLQPEPAAPKLFTEGTAASRLTFTHTENDFVDYNRDGLLKQMFSREGPALAVGDINGDGLDDVFFGNAINQPRALFVQGADGTFAAQKQPFLADALYTEDVAATFFDADNDKDLDLYVATGGNEIEDKTLQFDRFYRNDGKGGFTWDKTMTRVLEANSCVVAADFDRDGDQDLFVAGRLVPGQYGRKPEHALLVNNGTGTFTKGTEKLMPFAKDLGMVTDAIWADVDNDRFPDLVLAGDWMPLTILKNKAGKGFEKLENATLAETSGWWNTVRAADVDGDGDLDFIAGNGGLNSRITASKDRPARLYGKDFDGNGAYEQVMTCFRPRNGEWAECLMVQKPDLQKRIPSIKSKFIKYTDYGKAGYEDVFSEQQREGADTYTAQMAESVVILNDKGQHFTVKPLPALAQISPVRAIQTGDYNRDGKLDLLLAGNFFDVLTEVGRYDASYGLLLTGNGRGDFTPVPAQKSGFFVRGQVRRMAEVRGPGGRKRLVLAKNNDEAQVFEVGSPVIQ